MLDFYILNFDEPTPKLPNEKNYIGSFTLEHFKFLTQLTKYSNKLGLRLHFFEDFRVTKNQIEKLLDFINIHLKNKKIEPIEEGVYCRMYAVLNNAKNLNKELFAFCD